MNLHPTHLVPLPMISHPPPTLEAPKRLIRELGPSWAALAVGRKLLRVSLSAIESQMIRIEQRKHSTAPGTLSSSYQTAILNRSTWDSWDWSQSGEEWTQDAEYFTGLSGDVWKVRIARRFVDPNFRPGSTVLE